MIRCLEKLSALAFWQRFCLAVLFGLGCALALPPYNFWVLWFVGLPLFLALLGPAKALKLSHGFGLGWAFGCGYFLWAFHWIGYAFFVDRAFLWMMPFAVGGLACFMAIYWGLALTVVAWLRCEGLSRAFAVAACLGGVEWLRGRLFTGFPWAVPGLSVDGMGAVSQTAALWGMEGLTVFILLWAGAWPYLFQRRATLSHRLIAGLVMVSFVGAWGWGSYRLNQNPTVFDESVGLRIVQPNISQNDKWRGDNMDEIFAQLLALSAQPSSDGKPITHILWPESSIPFLIDESPEKRQELARSLAPKQVVMAGSLRRIPEPYNGEDKVFNSILMFSSTGKVVGHYDKRYLVPGGEFLPLQWLLQPLGFKRVVNLPGKFEVGTGAQSLAIPHAPPAAFSICYEAIFPTGVVPEGRRPAWLVNVTNDGWFGLSTGPYQHMAQARLRTIEQGLPLARAANTGISAIIDAYGRSIVALPLGVEGVVDAPLPLVAALPFYAHAPNAIVLSLTFLMLLGGLLLRTRP